MSPKKTYKRPKTSLFDDVSSNSGIEVPFADSYGAYTSEKNHDPKETDNPCDLRSSEETYSVTSRRRRSGVSVASSKSNISNKSSDSELDDQHTEQAELVAEAIDNSLVSTSYDIANAGPASEPNCERFGPEEQLWTNTVDDIPDFGYDAHSQVFDQVFPTEYIEYLVQCTNNFNTAVCNTNKSSTQHSQFQYIRLTTIEKMRKLLRFSFLHGNISKRIDLSEQCKKVSDVKKNNNNKHKVETDQECNFQGHWPIRQPAPENSKKKYSFLMCKMCSKNKKRVETSYRCIGCPALPPLCPECFQDYHKLLEKQ